MKQEMMEWYWHQLDDMQIIFYTTPQKDNHASTSSLNFFKGLMLFLTRNQQRQSTENLVNGANYQRVTRQIMLT